MEFITCGICSLAIALIFYFWRDFNEKYLCRQRLLRDRVTYMLWVMANAAARE